MRYTVKVRRTRHARDLLRRQRFVVVAISPGGKEIAIAKRTTRQRAFEAARNAVRVSGSASSSGFGSYVPGANPQDNPPWQYNPTRPTLQGP